MTASSPDQHTVDPPTTAGDALSSMASHLPTVGLDDLNEVAALLDRTDRKYVVNLAVIDRLLAELGPTLHVLEQDGQRSFGYHTTYFDTDRFELFRLAATRRRGRFKVRIRRYVESGDALLEVKIKGGRGRTVKHRFDHDAATPDVLESTARSAIDDLVQRTDLVADLVPTLTTVFARTTLLDSSAESRCTIDADLVCSAPGGENVVFDHLVLETKSTGTASPIDRWLWRRGVRPTRISKYSTAMAILHPELPRNRWHRTIHRYF